MQSSFTTISCAERRVLLGDTPLFDVELRGVEGDLRRVGTPLCGIRTVCVEAKEKLKRVTLQDEDGTLILREEILAIAAEAHSLQVHPQRRLQY